MEEHETSLPPCTLLTAILGGWICQRAWKGDHAGPSGVVRVCLARLAAEEGQSHVDLFSCDAMLVLLGTGIARQNAGEQSALERFAVEVADALRAHDQIPPQHEGVAVLLARLGFDLPPFKEGLVECRDPSLLGTILSSDYPAQRDLCTKIAVATRFGERPFPCDQQMMEVLTSSLPILMYHAFERHDFDAGAMLLRTIRYCAPAQLQPDMVEGHDFLLLHQGASGGFGEVLLDPSDAEAPTLTWEIQLPVTVSALWALGETSETEFSILSACES